MPEFSITPTPHEEAIALIRGKPVITREVFDQLLPELRGRAFTITGVEGADLMQRIRDLIAELPRGTVWDKAKAGIVDELSPYLGDGAERRAEILLRTHAFQAFQASNWRVAQEDEDTTHLQYLATEDDRVRDSHLALNGLILPKNDPFWDTHFPPWDWGCRCRVRPINPDLLAEAKAEDEGRAPDDKLVLEGPALQRLRDGHIERDGKTVDVSPPSHSSQENAFQWHPDNLRLPLAELKGRYDPETWNAFIDHMRAARLGPISALDWLAGTPLPKFPAAPSAPAAPKAKQFANSAEAKAWADEQMHPDRRGFDIPSRAALVEYQRGSADLNRALLEGSPLTATGRANARALDDAMAKSKLPADLTLYHTSAAVAEWNKVQPGQIFTGPAYLSTTLARDTLDAEMHANRRGVRITIDAPQGASGVYMDALDRRYADEVEVLLARGARFEVLEKKLAADGTLELHFELRK